MNHLQDTASTNLPSPAASSALPHHLTMEKRIDLDGTITYHTVAHDLGGAVHEKIYDHAQRLIKIVKRAGNSRCETFLDPASGAPTKVNEISTMPDGNLISSDILCGEAGRRSQIVTIFRPDGQLVRITERQSNGSMVTYQGQTDYDVNGTPVVTINQHTDPESGLLMHREQIHWMGESMRAMTEHFYFDVAGSTQRYVKILHQSGGGPFSEETQEFEPATGNLVRRELLAFDQVGVQTCLDILCYGAKGEIVERQSTFFDASGRAVFSRNLGDLGSNRLYPG